MMQIGCIVKSVAGHDKNKFYVVLNVDKDCVSIADGKARKLDKPKSKNVKHVRSTNKTLDMQQITTDKKLASALKPLNDALLLEKKGGE